MNPLNEALMAPPKKKAQRVDPNVKVIRNLARAGWGNPTHDGTVYVAISDIAVYVTNTYILRALDPDDAIAVALRSFAPDDTQSFTLRLRASGPNYGLAPQFATPKLGVEQVMALMHREDYVCAEITEWSPLESDGESFLVGTYTDPTSGEAATVRLNAKYLKAVTLGLTEPAAYVQVGASIAPVQITEAGTVVGVIMPVRV